MYFDSDTYFARQRLNQRQMRWWMVYNESKNAYTIFLNSSQFDTLFK